MKCPCTSGAEFADCCEPILDRTRTAKTAEELMRSRYTAYATGDIDWIIESQCPDGRAHLDRKATEEWSKRSTWHRLEVVNTDQGQPGDSEGFVEFKAHYSVGDEEITHHEIASFRKEDGVWYFVDGIEMKPRPFKRPGRKIGPNEPCPCGSEKKYKKCCGRPGAAT